MLVGVYKPKRFTKFPKAVTTVAPNVDSIENKPIVNDSFKSVY
jgi:hypothetical protein